MRAPARIAGAALAACLIFGVLGCEKRNEDFDDRIREYSWQIRDFRLEIEQLKAQMEVMEMPELPADAESSAEASVEMPGGQSVYLVIETWHANREEFSRLRLEGETGAKLHESLAKSRSPRSGLKTIQAQHLYLRRSLPSIDDPVFAPSAGPTFDQIISGSIHPNKGPDGSIEMIDIRDGTFTMKPSTTPAPNAWKIPGGSPAPREIPYGKAFSPWIQPPAFENDFGGIRITGTIGSFRTDRERFWLGYEYSSDRSLPPRQLQLLKNKGEPSPWRLYLPHDFSRFELNGRLAVEMGETVLLGAAPAPPPGQGSRMIVVFGRLLDGT